jgi:hypothetical protein
VLILLPIIILDMPYPKIVVTGDSIAQLSFQAGGYGSMLCDIVSGTPLSRLSFTFSSMARLTSSTAVWVVTIVDSSYQRSDRALCHLNRRSDCSSYTLAPTTGKRTAIRAKKVPDCASAIGAVQTVSGGHTLPLSTLIGPRYRWRHILPIWKNRSKRYGRDTLGCSVSCSPHLRSTRPRQMLGSVRSGYHQHCAVLEGQRTHQTT